MRIRTLWILFGVTGGFFVSMNIVGLLALAGLAILFVIPTASAWWLGVLGVILSILLVLGSWIGFVWLCSRWGKASQKRIEADPQRRTTIERSMLWVGILGSTAYLGVITFYAAVRYTAAKYEIHRVQEQMASDSTRRAP